MSMTIQGVIQKKNQRNVTTRWGEKTSYSIQVDGEWYSNGFKPVPYEEGQTVNFTYKMNGSYKNIDGFGAAPSGGAAPAPTTLGTPAPARSGGRVFPVPPDHADRSIIRQNSLAHAARLVSAMGIEGIPAEDIAETTINMAYSFEDYSSGQREVKAAEDMLNKPPFDE